jgi:hypothetical protein
MLGCGLMIHFRQPDTNIGYVIMCQIFIAFSGGGLVICQQMAVMASVPHANVAGILALLGLFSSIGSAIGSSISGAIWTNTFPGALLAALPDDAKADYLTIYSSLTVQLSYARGTDVRDAIIDAYSVAQRRMTIASTSVIALSIFCILLWKDFKVKDLKQVRGTVV